MGKVLDEALARLERLEDQQFKAVLDYFDAEKRGEFLRSLGQEATDRYAKLSEDPDGHYLDRIITTVERGGVL